MQELKQAYVYRRMTQPVLDAQYNIRAQIPDFAELGESWKVRSEAVRAALGGNAHIDLAYGDAPLQKLDLFLCGQAGRPLVVFIHGGYWRAQDKSEFSYVAEPFVADGINLAVINYRLAPHATMDDIVADVRDALAWLYRNAVTYGFDANRIAVTGSSAGGHLTVMSIVTDWAARGLPRSDQGRPVAQRPLRSRADAALLPEQGNRPRCRDGGAQQPDAHHSRFRADAADVGRGNRIRRVPATGT